MTVHNMPHAAAPFVNRVSEIAEITNRLNESDCRLLTLVGPGGMGKTRLAVRVATDCAEQFDDGVYFVPLQPLDAPEFILSAIIDIVSPQYRSARDLKQQLLQYLRDKALLLVLDNFEHLLDGADLLTEILAAAPDVKLLVTSREALSLQEEWRYPVPGLQYPETTAAEQPGAYSAVQLFVERARQVRGDLSLVDEQTAVIRICQLVNGMPLALELAAGWAKALQPREIVTEIQHSLDFLSTSLRNVPQRHQSITAVFEQTWERLSDKEQRVFSALSVFSGGFQREAAEAVAGVSMRVLSGLVDKSLLTRDPGGRYQIHELLRQYAQTRLETAPDEATRIHELHATYYLRFLHDRNHDLNGGSRQRTAALEIEADLDNIRAAWSWAVEQTRFQVLDQALHPLFQFYVLQSRLLEAINAFEHAAQKLDTSDPRMEISLANALGGVGFMCMRIGAFERSKVALERSWQLYAQHNTLPAVGWGLDPRLALAYDYLYWDINVSRAEQLAHDTFNDHTRREDHHNLAIVCYTLSVITRVQGKYEAARQYAQQGYASTLIIDDEWSRSYLLREWATASLVLGDLADARQRLQAAYVILEEFGDRRGMAEILTRLGRIMLLEGDNTEARQYYEQARNMCHELGVINGLIISLEGLGNSSRALGDYGEARRYLREALYISRQQMIPLTLSVFVGISELFLQTGKQARGLELLVLAVQHPASEQDTKDQAQRLLNRYPVAAKQAVVTDVDVIATALLDELLIADTKPEPLIEALTERELEILALIAADRSNREIADQLFLTVGTVKWYLTGIYGKLGVKNRTLAIMRARQLNLLP